MSSARGEQGAGAKVLRLAEDVAAAVREHAERDYPHECCGLLVGERRADGWEARGARPARNLNSERARDRYLLDPADFIRADREARALGLDIVGIYHSHPDHPALASETDRENAWPAFAYLIVGVRGGKAAEWRVWEYDGERFQERQLAGAPA